MRKKERRCRWSMLSSALAVAAALGLVALAATQALADESFIRGDANSDGRVSISDVHFMDRARAGLEESTCLDAADVDDDGLEGQDQQRLLRFLFEESGGTLPEPYPELGPDPTPDGLTCQSYGGGSPIEDPSAQVELRDVTHQGGHHRDGFLTISVSSSFSLAGYSVTLLDNSGIIENAGVMGSDSDRTGAFSEENGYMKMSRDPANSKRIRLGVLNSLVPTEGSIPPGEAMPVVVVSICLKPGVAAGDYRIVVEAAELADFESGRAIPPQRVSGTVTVQSSTTGELPCQLPVAPTTEFIRGDSNSDGKLSLADAGWSFNYLFLAGPTPPCLAAADADDNGELDIADPIRCLGYQFFGQQPPPPPFPDPGPDPTPDEWLACEDSGNGTPLEDPAAKLEVTTAAAAGGEDRLALITLSISNSYPIAGYAFELVDEARVLEDASGYFGKNVSGVLSCTGQAPEDTCTPRPDFSAGSVSDGKVRYGMYWSFVYPSSLPPGEGAAAIELHLCLKRGTKAGEYPLTLVAGEFTGALSFEEGGASEAPGRAIYPVLASGTLLVQADVVEHSDCDPSFEYLPPPEDIHILFKVEDASAVPGGAVSVPFVVKADRPSTGFTYSIDFDEGVLQATGTRKLWQKPGGTPYEFESFEFNNDDRTPGNGLDEGYLAGAAIISLTDTPDVLPPDEEVKVLEFDLVVDPSAAAGATELAFVDAPHAGGTYGSNKLIAEGKDITPALASSFVFINGRIEIVPDGIPFVRGDSNRNGGINLTDPVFTLNFLFLGGPDLTCPDASDSNDDGKVDVSDAVSTLGYLFLGSAPGLPQPFPLPGLDPTEDALGPCR